MIYAINKRTKEHRIVSSDTSSFYPPGCGWDIIDADPDGWIAWPFDDCPLPDGASHEVRFDDGRVVSDNDPTSWCWSHDPARRIVAYRPVLDTKPETPAWPQPGDMAEVHNEPGYGLVYGGDLLGEHVEVKAVFKSGHIKMAAIEYNGQCFCFRVDMLRPIRSEEDRAVDEMLQDCPYPGSKCTEIDCRALYRAGYRKTSAVDGEDK